MGVGIPEFAGGWEDVDGVVREMARAAAKAASWPGVMVQLGGGSRGS
jgi:hypothetical protein